MNKKPLISIILFFIFVTLMNAQEQKHTIQKGDTLYSVARKYSVQVKDLLRWNDKISAENLKIGQILVINPKKNLQVPEHETYNGIHDQYKVKKGDTYYRIAREHGMSVNELLALNGRSGSVVLKVGEIIQIKRSDKTQVVEEKDDDSDQVPVNFTESDKDIIKNGDVPHWPVAGRRVVLEGKLSGVEIMADESAYIYSVTSGDVVYVGPFREFGKVILIDHKGYIYCYGGSRDLFVNIGEKVEQGTRLGRLSGPGTVDSFRKVYFSVFKDGQPVNVNEAPRG